MSNVAKHIGGWILVYVVYTMMFAYWDNDFWGWREVAIVNLINVPLFAGAFYLMSKVQIPYLWNRGRYILFVLSFIISSVLIASTCRAMGILFINELLDYTYKPPFLSLKGYIAKTIRFYLPTVIILTWMNHVRQRKENERLAAIQKEKLDTELKYLKAQINPHFLFNTLNNLYSFVINQSPKAPDMILQLSSMLDYVLYQSQPDYVPLQKEIDAIRNFVALEQTRYGARLSVNIDVTGNPATLVAPLLMLSVVENAFKHGASGDIDSPVIRVTIHEEDGKVRCVVWNSKSKSNGQKTDNFKKGIGLKNIRRQLSLIYPEKHNLYIEDEVDSFQIDIALHAA